jgi:sec-independent protein translocase protein TatA
MGFPEILVIAIAVLVLFGARKIPEMMKGVGKGIREFTEEKDKISRDDKDDHK